MLKSIEKALKLSEIREKLNDLNAITDPTDAQQTEERDLIADRKTTETEYREALTDEADEHATVPVEDREYREVLGRGNVGRILTAFVEHRSTDGAEAEIQQHRSLNANQIPLDMLRAPEEHRAVTTGTDERRHVRATGDHACVRTRDRGLHWRGSSDRDAGLVAYPVLDQRPDVGGPHTDSTSVDETTGSFSSELLTPGRIQASYFYKRIDAARFASLDLALRQALNGGLEEKLDDELIAGSEGLLTGTNLANHAASAVTTFAAYLSAFGHSRVDGRYAAALADVRTVAGARRTHTWAISTARITPTTARLMRSPSGRAAYGCRHTCRR